MFCHWKPKSYLSLWPKYEQQVIGKPGLKKKKILEEVDTHKSEANKCALIAYEQTEHEFI